ncbi:MAG: hypothetical protein AAGB12_14615 [Pseudomonadota bacterium]
MYRIKKLYSLVFFMYLSITQAIADDAFEKIMVSLQGQWQGELYYLDYQTQQRFSIPYVTKIRMTPDRKTLIRENTFTDPGKKVYTMEMTAMDVTDKIFEEAYFRDGKGEFFQYTLDSVDFVNDKDWQMRYSHKSTDDNRPAQIRFSVTRKNNTIESQKSIKFLDKKNQEYFVRNGYILNKK